MDDFPLDWATDAGVGGMDGCIAGGVPIPRALMMASQLHGSSRGLLQSSSSLSTSHQYQPDHSTSHSPYLHQSLSPAGSLNQNYQEHPSPAAVQFSQQSGGAGHTTSSACYSSPTDNSNNMYGGGTGLSPHPPPQSPSPHMWQTQFMDLDGDDLDIKIEPFELLGMDSGNSSAINHSMLTDFSMDGINSSFGATGNGGQDDNSILGVGSGSRLFQDSCYPDDLISGSDTTTCLDPQHSSPAAMAVVRPDEVLGIGHHHHHGNSGPSTASAGSSVTNSFSQMLLQPNNSISSNCSSSGQRQQQIMLLQQHQNHQQTLQLNNLLQQHQQQQQQRQQQHQQQMSHSFTSNSFLSSQMLDDINNSRGQGGGGFSTSVSGGSLSLMQQQPQHESPIKVEPNSGDLPSSFSPPCSAWPDPGPCASNTNLFASSSLPTNAYSLLLEASSRSGEQSFGSVLGQLSHEQLLMQELFERDIGQGSPLLQALNEGDAAMMEQELPQQQQQMQSQQQQQQMQLQKQMQQEHSEQQLRQHLHQQQQQHQQQQDLIQRQANQPQLNQNQRPVSSSTQQIHNSQKQVMQLHRQLQQQAQRRQLEAQQKQQQQLHQQQQQEQQQQHQKRITSQQQDIPGRKSLFDSSSFPLTPNNTPVQSSFCIPSTLKEMLMQSPSTSLSSPISPQSACSPVSACSPLPMSSPGHNAPSPITVQSSCQDESIPFDPLSHTIPPNAVMSPQHFSPSPTPQQQQPPQSVSPQYILSTSSPNLARLSSSAPALSILDQIWKRREPRKHLLSTGSLAEEQSIIGGSSSSLTNSILSPAPNELSIDESGLDSDEESEIENYDSDSDNESIITLDPSSIAGPNSGGGPSSSTSAATSGRGGASSSSKERHFWQYNVQAKGPKGQRVNLEPHLSDPHQLLTVADPVFSSTVCSLQGIKHSGKARRGDGNDLNPNPTKLVSIGRQLGSLNKDIMEMTPVSEQPFHIRPKSRKEKNKLASRACRLKKKAQHEANKIKLFGLGEEHKALLQQVQQCRALLYKKAKLAHTGSAGEGGGGEATNADTLQVMLTDHITALVTNKPFQIAGQTADFVNSVIEKCRQGRSNGGLDDLAHRLDNLRTPSSLQPPPAAGDGRVGNGSGHISSRDYMADFV